MQEHERRQALAAFLRARRMRLSPAEVGLPESFRRRTPGLRREEVAQLANIGTSWYVWLEQGRDVHPSIQVLESLAQALKLTLNERRHLFLLAGQTLPAHAFPSEESVSTALEQVLHELDPVPAYILGRRWDFLAWNRTAEHVFMITEPEPHHTPHTHNLVWRLFTSPSSRERYPDWEEVAHGVLAEFYTANARYPGDAWFEQLIEDLKRVSPEFSRWWPQHETSSTMDGHKVIEHPILGHLEFEHTTLQVPSDPDVRVMIYTPDSATRTTLKQFLGQQLVSNS